MESSQAQTYRRLEELIPAHWEQGDVEANGITQHYLRTGGDKPVLLLLHGFMMAGPTWLRVAKALESDYDIIMLDARAHGRSGSGNPEEFEEPTTTLEDTAAFIRAMGLDKPFILGHSMGASTGIYVAATYPELVRALIAEDPGLRPLPLAVFESDGYKAWFNQWLDSMKLLPDMSHDERVAAYLANNRGLMAGQEEDVVAAVDAQVNLDLDMLHAFTYQSKRIPLKDVIPQVTVPQMLMFAVRPVGGGPAINVQQGEQDRAEIENKWNGGVLVVFENTGHFIHLERFDEFIDAVKTFFAKH